MIYKTRAASHLEEPLTIVCKHITERVMTDNGPGERCSHCSLFWSDDWFSPVPILAETSPATA
jgi:hypothetical protein